MSKNTVINIWNEHDWVLDDEMLATCLRVAARRQHAAEQINIYPQERVPDDAPAWKNPGWLEWVVTVKYRSGNTLTIGVIQRHKGAEIECHS